MVKKRRSWLFLYKEACKLKTKGAWKKWLRKEALFFCKRLPELKLDPKAIETLIQENLKELHLILNYRGKLALFLS